MRLARYTSLGHKSLKGKFNFMTVPQSRHAEQTTMQQLVHDTEMRPEEQKFHRRPTPRLSTVKFVGHAQNEVACFGPCICA